MKTIMRSGQRNLLPVTPEVGRARPKPRRHDPRAKTHGAVVTTTGAASTRSETAEPTVRTSGMRSPIAATPGGRGPPLRAAVVGLGRRRRGLWCAGEDEDPPWPRSRSSRPLDRCLRWLELDRNPNDRRLVASLERECEPAVVVRFQRAVVRRLDRAAAARRSRSVVRTRRNVGQLAVFGAPDVLDGRLVPRRRKLREPDRSDRDGGK